MKTISIKINKEDLSDLSFALYSLNKDMYDESNGEEDWGKWSYRTAARFNQKEVNALKRLEESIKTANQSV